MRKIKIIAPLVASLLFFTAIALAVSAAATPVNAYEGGVSADAAYENDGYGVRLNYLKPFSAISIIIPTWGQQEGAACTFSLYRWAGTYETTIAAEPIASVRHTDIRDCATCTLSFDTQQPGEYLFLLSDMVKSIGVWKANNAKYGLLYKDGLEIEGDLQMSVTFDGRANTYFGKVESVYKIDKVISAPEEPQISAESTLSTHVVMPDTWVGTDGLGRELLTNKDVGDPREDRYVSIFYWTWHVPPYTDAEAVNLQEFVTEHPEIINDYDSPLWPTGSRTYYWNEPIYGYYSSKDPWVVRKQSELLANAGIDAIFTDNTNGNFTWRPAYLNVYETFTKAREGGVLTPKVSYMLPFGANENSLDQIRNIFKDIYLQNRYQDLWFYWNGKPMVMAHLGNLSDSMLDKSIDRFFVSRMNEPSYFNKNGAYDWWGWLSAYPQAVYRRGDRIEQVTVGVAQNANYKTSSLTAMNGENVMGRTYTSEGYDTRENAVLYGANFAEQFEYAIEKDPRMIFITGWNEWTAGRHEEWGGVENAFPDQFNDEFSRDIEPTKGALKDHYYYQMVNYIRRQKGVRPIPTPTGAAHIDITADSTQWESVGPAFNAYIGGLEDRDYEGHGDVHYTETSGRNDIISAKLARDGENLYILVECNEDITPYTDPLWMNILLDTDQSAQGWETFDFVLNKTAPSATEAVLERFTGEGYSSEVVGKVAYTVSGKHLQICVPKSLLGIEGYDFTVNFSVTDNVHDEGDYTTFSGDIMDFYISGDVAPGARFKFSYISTEENAAAHLLTDAVTGDTDRTPITTYILAIGAPIVLIGVAAAVVILVVRRKKA